MLSAFLTDFTFIQDATKKPTLSDLNKFVQPKIAMKWHNLGTQLLSAVDNGVDQLEIIGVNNPRDVEACCTEMFCFWLNNANDASWEKLVEAVKIIGYNVLAEDLKKVLVYIIATV